jgi:hypothetical protein
MFVSFAGELGNRIEHPKRPAAAPSAGSGPSAPTATPAAPVTLLEPAAKSPGGEIKVLPLIWAVTRERLANFLERLSTRIRPN